MLGEKSSNEIDSQAPFDSMEIPGIVSRSSWRYPGVRIGAAEALRWLRRVRGRPALRRKTLGPLFTVFCRGSGIHRASGNHGSWLNRKSQRDLYRYYCSRNRTNQPILRPESEPDAASLLHRVP